MRKFDTVVAPIIGRILRTDDGRAAVFSIDNAGIRYADERTRRLLECAITMRDLLASAPDSAMATSWGSLVRQVLDHTGWTPADGFVTGEPRKLIPDGDG